MNFTHLVLQAKSINVLTICIVFFGLCSCNQNRSKLYNINIYQTSQAGDNLKKIESSELDSISSKDSTIKVQLLPDKHFQEYIGFGASFTESSAWNLATIPVSLRDEVLTKLFSPTKGAGFSLTRTHINSSDYSNGHYTYVEEGDESLETSESERRSGL